jgi:hypothetical protein
MTTVDITANNLSLAWARTLMEVGASSDRKAFHTVTRITDVDTEDCEIRSVADTLLAMIGLPDVETVANTIFPSAMSTQEPDPVRLGERYMAVLPQLRTLDHQNTKDTYFQRLVAYPGPSGTEINQIAELVRRVRVERRTRAPKSARYEVGIDVPGTAAPIFEASRDTSAMAFPCLSLLSFQLEYGTRLSAVAHYRSQYLLQRGYGNYLGIARLMRYVAATAGVEPGQLMVVAGHACADHMNGAHQAILRNVLDSR